MRRASIPSGSPPFWSCSRCGRSGTAMTMEEFKAISPVFEEDIYDAISMKTCVEMRNTIGAPGKAAMEKVIAIEEAYLVTE